MRLDMGAVDRRVLVFTGVLSTAVNKSDLARLELTVVRHFGYTLPVLCRKPTSLS